MQSRKVKLQFLEAEFQRQENLEVPVKLSILINEIDEATYQTIVNPAINLYENEKKQYNN